MAPQHQKPVASTVVRLSIYPHLVALNSRSHHGALYPIERSEYEAVKAGDGGICIEGQVFRCRHVILEESYYLHFKSPSQLSIGMQVMVGTRLPEAERISMWYARILAFEYSVEKTMVLVRYMFNAPDELVDFEKLYYLTNCGEARPFDSEAFKGTRSVRNPAW
jgi:hypothetical protein